MVYVFDNCNFGFNFNNRNILFILPVFLLLSLFYIYYDSFVLVEASELSVFLPNEKPFNLTYGE